MDAQPSELRNPHRCGFLKCWSLPILQPSEPSKRLPPGLRPGLPIELEAHKWTPEGVITCYLPISQLFQAEGGEAKTVTVKSGQAGRECG